MFSRPGEGRRHLRDHPAGVAAHYQHAVAHKHGLFDVVRHEQHRALVAGPQGEQLLLQEPPGKGVEVGSAFAQIAELENPAEIGELAERVARLEAYVVALKRALKKLRSDAVQEFEAN